MNTQKHTHAQNVPSCKKFLIHSEHKAIVFCRPSARSFLPSCLTGIERVVSAKLLGVKFCSNLKFDEHVKTF